MTNGTWTTWKSVKKSPQRESPQSMQTPKNAKLSNSPRTGYILKLIPYEWHREVEHWVLLKPTFFTVVLHKPVKVQICRNSCLLCPWCSDCRYGRVCEPYGNWCCWYWKYSSNPKNWRYQPVTRWQSCPNGQGYDWSEEIFSKLQS